MGAGLARAALAARMGLATDLAEAPDEGAHVGREVRLVLVPMVQMGERKRDRTRAMDSVRDLHDLGQTAQERP